MIKFFIDLVVLAMIWFQITFIIMYHVWMLTKLQEFPLMSQAFELPVKEWELSLFQEKQASLQQVLHAD